MAVTASTDPTVLVVDDERQLADLYAGWLADDYDVRVAYDGDEAVRSIDESVEVVLLDRRMPGRSGDDVLETVRDRGEGCRIAMVTAVEPDFDILEMGFDDYLLKPVTYEELKHTIDRLLTRNTYGEEVDEYARLLSTKAALETQKGADELARSERFEALESRIARLEARVDRMVENFDEEDVAAVLRDLPVEQGA